MTTTENSTQPAAETTEAVVYGPFDLIDVSGARNRVYLIPAAESDSGKPEVFVWGGVGAGEPERAWHHRWLCLGKVSQKAVPAAVEAALREHEESIVEISSAYRGAEWNGNNPVGTWSEDFDSDLATQEIEESLGRVEAYCAASDYYAPVTLHDVVDCDLGLEELVAREVDQAAGEYALESSDVCEWIEAAAKDWLESNDDPSEDDERNAKMRVRLLRLLGREDELRALEAEQAVASITDDQIKALRREAIAAQDYDQSAICDLALDGEIDVDDYTCLSHKFSRTLRSMDADEARRLCARAILDARAQD